jgi:hypothetical protein
LSSDHIPPFARHCLLFGAGIEEANAEMPERSAVPTAAALY